MRPLAGLVAGILLSCPAAAQVERWAHTQAELASAIAASGPGDTVVMANGTWTDAVISFFAEGAEGDSITLRAETAGQVILDGASRLRIGGRYLKVEGLWFDGGALSSGHVIEFRRSSSNLAHHSRLTNCAVTSYNPPSRSTEYKWVSIYGTNNRVDHCHFAGKEHDGATVVVWLRDPPNDGPVRHRIDQNYFGHRPDLGKNGGESLRIGTSSRSMQDSHVTVEHNLFEECDGEIEIISNKSGQNIFRHNTFRRSSGMLTLRHGNEAQVYGNFFFGEGKSGSGGVRIIGERHRVYNNYFQDLEGTGYRAAVSVVNGVPNSPLNRYFQVKRVQIVFNTFVNVREAFVIGAGKSAEQSEPPDSLLIASNLVSTSRGPIIEYEDTPLSVEYVTNIFYGASVGITDSSGFVVIDPELEQSEGLWRPVLSSPAVNTATAFDFASVDIDGQQRDALPDIGADEWSVSPIVYRPLTRQDVGPDFMDIILQDVDRVLAWTPAVIAYPNPFSSNITFDFTLDQPAPTRLTFYDVWGRVALRAFHGDRMVGAHSVTLDASELASGAYIAVLEVSGQRQSMVVIRR